MLDDSNAQHIDNYRLGHELGRGGMAVVYEATDANLGRRVALKLLHEHIAGHPEYRDRLAREARAVAKLKHPNVLQIYACSPPNAERGYIVAELIEGPTLARFVEERGFRLPIVVAMLAQALAEGLAHAHEHHVVHRDIKPENVMIDRAGVPKITDFGLARLLDVQKVTLTGALLGSPAHMAPEVIEGEASTEQSDLFALGTTLYFALTGRLPFEGRNPAVVLNAILHGQYPDPQGHQPALDDELAELIRGLLMRDPADRPTSAASFAAACRAYLRTHDVEDAHADLRSFFQDPDAYERSMLPRLVHHYAQGARDALHEGRATHVLRKASVLQALAPEHPALDEVLAGLRRRQEARRLWIAVGAVGLALGAMITLALALQATGSRSEGPLGPSAQEQQESPPRTPASETPPTSTTSVVTASQTLLTDALHRASVRALTQSALDAVDASVAMSLRAALPPPPRPGLALPRTLPQRPPLEPLGQPGPLDLPASDASLPPGRVRLRVWPPAAEVLVAGERLGVAGELVDDLVLPPGSYLIVARIAELDASVQRTIAVQPGGELDVRITVPWPPASLFVDTNREVIVLVDGEMMGRGNERILVPIRTPEPERRVRVSVLPEGTFGSRIDRVVTVRTGAETRVDAP